MWEKPRAASDANRMKIATVMFLSDFIGSCSFFDNALRLFLSCVLTLLIRKRKVVARAQPRQL